MTFEELKAARESYAYIPARLVQSDQKSAKLWWESLYLDVDVPLDWQKGAIEVRRKYSSVQLDTFHHDLLHSKDDEHVMQGLLSIVFWGFVAGVNGRVNVGRALARSRALILGRKNLSAQDPKTVLDHLKKARKLIKAARVGDALREARNIQFLGMSFASKVVMFLNPRIAAVYDSVISNRLKMQSDSLLKSLYVATLSPSSISIKTAQCTAYENWCHWCLEKANALNYAAFKWKDWNGIEYNWRAVDVERALFALGRR